MFFGRVIHLIPLVKPFLGNRELKEVKSVFQSGWVAGQGPESKEFEEAFKKKFGFHNAVAVNNCTAALHLALLCLGVKKGDEVLVSDYTYPATAHAVEYCGAKPVFVDARLDTYNMDVSDAEEKVSDATKVIMPVHAFGQSADMRAVKNLAKKHGLNVVEDAACAAGAKYAGNFVGEFGDVGCFSFHARKGLTTGEGGMLVSRSEKIAEHARKLSCFGIQSAFERQRVGRSAKEVFRPPVFTELGYNYKLSDILSAIGLVQLAKLDSVIARKRVLAAAYGAELDGVEGITPPFEDPRCFHVYQSFVCLLDSRVSRDGLIAELRRRGVYAQIGTYSCHMQPVYGLRRARGTHVTQGTRGTRGACGKSRELFERSIALPLFYDLSEADVKSIVKKVRLALKKL